MDKVFEIKAVSRAVSGARVPEVDAVDIGM